MRVEIDEHSGFCFGVTSAIEKAEEELKAGPLCCLGDIVHNGQEVARLEQAGLKTIDYEQFKSMNGGRVLLRAHGEPPSTYETARRNGIEIIDASCPVVLHLQKRIRSTYLAHPNAQITPLSSSRASNRSTVSIIQNPSTSSPKRPSRWRSSKPL